MKRSTTNATTKGVQAPSTAKGTKGATTPKAPTVKATAPKGKDKTTTPPAVKATPAVKTPKAPSALDAKIRELLLTGLTVPAVKKAAGVRWRGPVRKILKQLAGEVSAPYSEKLRFVKDSKGAITWTVATTTERTTTGKKRDKTADSVPSRAAFAKDAKGIYHVTDKLTGTELAVSKSEIFAGDYVKAADALFSKSKAVVASLAKSSKDANTRTIAGAVLKALSAPVLPVPPKGWDSAGGATDATPKAPASENRRTRRAKQQQGASASA